MEIVRIWMKDRKHTPVEAWNYLITCEPILAVGTEEGDNSCHLEVN